MMEHSNSQHENKAQHEEADDKGGWITFPFIIGSVMGLTIAATCWYANIVVYAMKKYNIKGISAAQLQSVVGAGVNFFPIIGAILADSFFPSHCLVLVSCFVSLLGGTMFILSSAIPSLRPAPCTNPASCSPPSTLQYAFLYATLAISMLGFGGTRFVLASLGADQFKNPEQQRVFFNWFIFSIEACSVLGFTVVIYLQDKGKWTLSFGLSAAVNVVAIVLFLIGLRFFRLLRRQGSPFISIARVVVASLRKSPKLSEQKVEDDYFYGTSKSNKLVCDAPTPRLRFFNRAALIKGRDQNSKPLKKSWTLCTVEEVEDLKKLIKALPIWSGGILLSTSSGVAASLVILQCLTMNRSIGPHFEIPAASILVFPLICGSISLIVLDRVVYPLWKKLFGKALEPLKRIGIGYLLTLISMISFALIEKNRLKSVVNNHQMISALWLILPLGLLGVSSAFYYPAELAFFYQELPKSLRSTAASMAALHMAVGYYLSTVFISLVQRSSSWLPNDINQGRMDNVYWTLGVIGVINFGYYLLCAKLYKYTNNLDESVEQQIQALM